MCYSNSNHNSLLFIAVFIVINSHYVSPFYRVFRQKEDLLTVGDIACHKYNSLAFFNNTFLGCRCSNGAGIYHALIKDKTAFCRSSQDLGCYMNLRDRKGGDVSSSQVYVVDYPDATYKYSLVESYKLQIWNIDADRVEIWSDVTETFWKRYFEITQNGLRVKDLQNIWNGHAIRIIFKLKNKADQCLFIKVPGSIDYPAVIKDIPTSKEIQDFITPSAEFKSTQQSLPLTTTIVPTLLMSIDPTNIWKISVSRSAYREISMSVFASSVMPISSDNSMSRSVFVSSVMPMSSEISMSRPVFVPSITPMWSIIQATSSFSYQIVQSITSEDQSMSTSNQPVPATSMQMIVSSQSSLASTVVQIKASQSSLGTISSSLDPWKTSSLAITPERISSSVSSSPFTPRAQFTVCSAGSIQSSTVLTNTTVPPADEKEKVNAPMIAGVIISLVGLLVFGLVVALYVARKRLRTQRQVQPEDQLALGEVTVTVTVSPPQRMK